MNNFFVVAIVLALCYQILCLPLENEVTQRRFSRIHNGSRVIDMKRFSYQAGLRLYETDNKVYTCGGSIVSRHYILTAAHCMKDIKKVSVHLGTTDILNPDPDSIVINVDSKNFIIHPDYDVRTKLNDVALIRLDNPIQFTEKIKPIKLMPKNLPTNLFDGRFVTIAGWGITTDKVKSGTPKLQAANVRVMPNSECARHYGKIIKPEHICTAADNNIGVCGGDSGGPMITFINDQLYQIGIAQFMKIGTCDMSVPRVFARIAPHLSWICQNTQHETCISDVITFPKD